MAASLSPQPFLQFFDINGNPLTGGSLSTFIAGSNTPIATYTDASASVLNPVVITLDSYGIADVWLLSTVAYKFVIKDSNNVPIKTVDNITVGGSGGTGGTVDWSSITNKPLTFTPSAHNQSWATITNSPTTVGGYGITDVYTKTEVDAKDTILQDQININTSAVSDLDARLTTVEGDVTTIQGDITNLQATDIGLQNQINVNTSAISVLQANDVSLFNSVGSLNSSVATLSGAMYKVKTSVSDTSPGYLATKIVEGNQAIDIVESTGTLRISGTGIVKSDNSDTDPAGWGSLQDKLLPGANMTMNVITCAGTRRIQFNAITSGSTSVSGDHKVMASLTDPSYGTLVEKLINVDGSTFGVVTCAGVQKVQIAADTYKTKVTSGANAGYLNDVILTGAGVSKTLSGDTLTLTASGSGKVGATSADANPGYLFNKLEAGNNVVITTSGNKVQVNVDLLGAQPNAFCAEGGHQTGGTGTGTIKFNVYNKLFGNWHQVPATSTWDSAIVTSGKWQVDVAAQFGWTPSTNVNTTVANRVSAGYYPAGGSINQHYIQFVGTEFSNGSTLGGTGDYLIFNRSGQVQLNFKSEFTAAAGGYGVTFDINHFRVVNSALTRIAHHTIGTNNKYTEYTSDTAVFAGVLDVEVNDYVEVIANMGASTSIDNNWLTADFIHEPRVNNYNEFTLMHLDSVGALKRKFQMTPNSPVLSANAISYILPLSYSSVFDCSEGDKFTLWYMLSEGTELTQVTLAGHATGVQMCDGGEPIDSDLFVHTSGYDAMSGPIITPYVQISPEVLVSSSLPGVIESDGNFFYINVSDGGSTSGGQGGGAGLNEDAVATFPIALASNSLGNFNGSYGACTGVYIPYNTTVNQIAGICTQTGSGNLYFAIYDASFNLVEKTSAFSPSSIGAHIVKLNSSVTLLKNRLYYMFVGGNANGCYMLGATGMYSLSSPMINKVDENVTSPPAVMGGSYNGDRFWLVASNSNG